MSRLRSTDRSIATFRKALCVLGTMAASTFGCTGDERDVAFADAAGGASGNQTTGSTGAGGTQRAGAAGVAGTQGTGTSGAGGTGAEAGLGEGGASCDELDVSSLAQLTIKSFTDAAMILLFRAKSIEAKFLAVCNKVNAELGKPSNVTASEACGNLKARVDEAVARGV